MPEFQRRPTLLAQRLRREATPAERALWYHLSARKLAGFKFSRQMPVGPFICDFLCRTERLVIELDGYSHDLTQERDASRDRWLRRRGYRILRFTNREVSDNIDGVLFTIARILAAAPPPTPPASGRGGES
ncbi:MAG: endonuclease domain-containing protein [Sphingomonas sanxanigenens]|uniref:Endonuclease domain-containing protein n=1 Tax=Sphingomonas sanxanigenens TaxID=397260 RepID=A0A2W5AEV1_9SPHN|nr:MAG: endonuclease domain-containing protein [Sphingomonas sanxanigenens]